MGRTTEIGFQRAEFSNRKSLKGLGTASRLEHIMPLNSWFGKRSRPDCEWAERRPVRWLAAYHLSGDALKQDIVKDISSSGLYLVTDERWLPGALISLTLQRKGPPEESSERRITLKARAVRWGEDGVGLSFILPTDVNLRLWDEPLRNADETEAEGVLQKLRRAKALAFLSRICPTGF